MAEQGDTLSDVLRRAIVESGAALIALERATGVQRMSIARFLRGETSLRLDKADKLAAYFGLELRPKRKGR
jgi:plasmid maintenance system antidote protein VapI